MALIWRTCAPSTLAVMNHQLHQLERTTERLAASRPAPSWGEEEARILLADAELWAHEWAVDRTDEHVVPEVPTARRLDVLVGLVLLTLIGVIVAIGLSRT